MLDFVGVAASSTVPQLVDVVYGAFCDDAGGEENLSEYEKAMWRMIAVITVISNTYRLTAWEE